MVSKKTVFMVLGTIISLVLTLSPAAQGEMSIGFTGGGVGQPFTMTLEGPPNGSYFLVMSTNTGPTVTPWVVLDVGFELLTFSASIPGFVDYFDGTGKRVLNYAAPNDPILDGLNLNFQNCLLNSMQPPILDVSNLYRVTLAFPNTFAYTLESMPSKRVGMATAVLPDGTVMLAGGSIEDPVTPHVTDTVLLYRPNLEAFEVAPFTLPAPRVDMTAIVLDDGQTLLLGGLNAVGNPTTTSWLFDPSDNSFTAAGAMSLTRIMFQAALLDDGRVLVTGGYTDPTDETSMINTLQKSTEIFDSSVPGFSAGPDMARHRAGHTATKLNSGKVLVAGGVSYFEFLGIKIPEVLDKGQVYTPSGGMGSFGSQKTMPEARAAHTAILLDNGKVLLASGATGNFTNYNVTGTCALFNPTNESFSSAGTMATGRVGPNLIILPDSRVIAVAGGAGDLTNPVILATSEIYDPAGGTGGTWSAGPSLSATRFWPGFAALPDGTYLFAGGFSGPSAAAIKTAEVYQP